MTRQNDRRMTRPSDVYSLYHHLKIAVLYICHTRNNPAEDRRGVIHRKYIRTHVILDPESPGHGRFVSLKS
jgi:hypothetical protein